MAKSLSNYYVWAIKALVLAIPFLSVWIATSMYFPYISGRNFVFRMLVEVALVLWGALAILNKSYRPKLKPIMIAVLAFVAVIGVADLLGVDPYNSIWSRLERMEGYMMILHLAAYFTVLTSVFRDKKEWKLFFNSILAAGIMVSGYGVMQVLGLKEAIQGGNVRIDGTIGNPTYLAAYLTFAIAIALMLFFQSSSKAGKYFYGSVAIFQFIVMYFTATRGAALALGIAIPLFLFLYLFLFRGQDGKEKLFKKIAVGILAALVIAPVLLMVFRNTEFVQNNNVLSRFASISFGDKTIRSRFMIWGIGTKAFAERPVLGWGQENFLQAFSKYYDPRLYDQEPWFDRPHNIVFEWLINGGILGLLAYLSLFGAFGYSVFKEMKKGSLDKKEGLVLLVLPVAYLAQNFFVFDNFNTYVLFFGLLAYANSLYGGSAAAEGKEKEHYGSQKLEQASIGFLAISLVLVGFLIYIVNIKPMLAGKAIIDAFKATTLSQKPVETALASFKRGLDYGTFANAEILEQLARVSSALLGQQAVSGELKIQFLDFAITSLENYLKGSPNNIRLHLMVAGLYQNARALNPQLVMNARTHIKQALDLSPTKQQVLFLLADNFLLTNETQKAFELVEQAAKLSPMFSDVQINYATVALVLGKDQVIQGVVENLQKIWKAAAEKDSSYTPLWQYILDLERLSKAYKQVGRESSSGYVVQQLLAVKDEAEKGGISKAYNEVVDRVR